ncbi:MULTISPECIES: cupin domain-containing protein [Synechococcales]|uniref:cupin domain-containing protein n=1 Tax=Synechococcus sp. CS-1333 TaxID=2848638 RepID=UPI00223B7A2E|nr:cupin domain-containing protein [Synechococcus sp. CS-1333]
MPAAPMALQVQNKRPLSGCRPWLALLLLGGSLLLPVPPALADGEPAAVKVRTLVKAGEAWNGTRLPAYPKGEPEITVLHITIPPGVQLPMHTHPVINAGMLIRGQLLVTSKEGARLQLKAGEGLIEMVNQPHYGTNNGNEPAEIVVVYAGEKGKPITVLEPAAGKAP